MKTGNVKSKDVKKWDFNQIKLLTQLSPAEILLIDKKRKVTDLELIETTLIDFIFKNILIIEEEHFQTHPRDPIRTFLMIRLGPEHESYNYKFHEIFFLTFFKTNTQTQIRLEDYLRLCCNKFSRKFVFRSEQVRANFDWHFLGKYLNFYWHSEKGKETKKQINREKKILENELPQLIETQAETALEIIQKIQGKILLLEYFNLWYLTRMEELLEQKFPGQYMVENRMADFITSFQAVFRPIYRAVRNDHPPLFFPSPKNFKYKK